MESGLDNFNDETFGETEIVDWEFEHEKFVLEYDADKLPPSPHEIPKIWETADLSDFWSAADLDVSQPYDTVLNFEESVDKLVREDELEDPAILNISKYGPRLHKHQAIPFVPFTNSTNIWGLGPSQTNLTNYQRNNNAENLDLLSEQITSNLNVSDARKMAPPCSPLPPLMRIPVVPPEQYQQLRLGSMAPLHPQRLILPHVIAPNTTLQRPQPIPLRSGFMAPLSTHSSYSRFTAPPPPLISSSTPLPSSGHVQKPLPISPNAHFSSVRQLSQQPLNFLFQQIPRFSPLDASKLLDTLYARIEAEQSDETSFNPRRGSWMSPQDQLLVLNCQLRSLIVANPYVEDYYFAVRFLRLMTKVREAKLMEGALPSQVPPPYASIPAPITSSQLLSPDHPHRIALRFRLIIALVRRRRTQPPSIASTIASQSVEPPGATFNDRPTVAAALPPSSSTATSSIGQAGLYDTQLGRPTKSSINTQRIIAELSVATALDEEQKEHFRTEAEEVASMLQMTDNTPTRTPGESSSRSARHQAVVNQRRRLSVLARIERLYATVLNIDETNVSLARIFVRNDESRHLMGHRLNLLKVLHRDLFLVKRTPTEPITIGIGHNIGNGDSTSAMTTTRRLAMEIFEVPKGVRLFPIVLRFLFPEDSQFCVSELISQFTKVVNSIKPNVDAYAQMLYNPCRDIIYKAAEISPAFIPSCLKIPLSNFHTTLSSDALINGELEPNAVAMFSSRLGVSLFLCLMDACARNSQRDDPTLFCELFFYACRILDEQGQEQQLGELPTPLERFPHFAQLDPRFLMPPHLAVVYERKALMRFGATLRHLSIQPSRTNATIVTTTSASLSCQLNRPSSSALASGPTHSYPQPRPPIGLIEVVNNQS